MLSVVSVTLTCESFVRCRMSNSAVSEVFSCEAAGLGTVSLHAALLPSLSSSALKVISAPA